MIVVLNRDQFIDALPDEDMRLRIRLSRPPTLRQALETALELESYSMVSKRARPVSEVHLERGDESKGAKYHCPTTKVYEEYTTGYMKTKESMVYWEGKES